MPTPHPAAAPPTPFHTDTPAARRWAAQPHAATPWLHEEVARRMAQRLSVIRLPVARWAHWQPAISGLQGHALVAAHHPQAQCWRVQPAHHAAPAATPAVAGLWQRLRGRHAEHTVPSLPDGAVDMVWANMLLHQQPDALALLADWQRALATNGFVMFSCLGPDSLHQLRTLYARLGWPPPAQAFADMHDWGDALLGAGFADPVVDMEKITLTFETPQRLLAELRELGRNLHPQRFAALRTPRWRRRLLAEMDAHLRPSAGEPLALTFEVIYGHAIKPAPRHAVAAHTTIPLQEMRQSLRKGKASG